MAQRERLSFSTSTSWSWLSLLSRTHSAPVYDWSMWTTTLQLAVDFYEEAGLRALLTRAIVRRRCHGRAIRQVLLPHRHLLPRLSTGDMDDGYDGGCSSPKKNLISG